jgi:thioredoxin reductase (NADPH)
VAVVGGGDAACQAALHLAEGCEAVTLIVRGPSLSARREYVLRAADNPAIEFRWETTVERIVGESGVEALVLANAAGGGTVTEPFAAVFVFAGLVPNLQFAPAALQLDAQGRAVTDAQYRTSMPGVFVVGAVRSGNGGSLLSAMGEASTAAALAVAGLD